MSSARAAPGRWIVSGRFDLAILVAPFVASLLSLFTLRDDVAEVPLWAYLLLIVAFDVAHVWATVFITYLDREALRAHRLLYWLPIPLSFIISYRLHAYSSNLFWTLLAYVAIYHFIKQQWGFIALYKARAGERERLDYYLDKYTLWMGALGPVMLWHASPARQFDWFNAGESFIVTIPEVFRPDIAAAWAAFGLAYVLRQAQLWRANGRVNLGKNLWMACSWLSWAVGIGLSNHPLVSAAFLNLFHGIPFLALVWHRSRRVAATSPGPGWRARLMSWLTARRRWAWFYLLALAPAVVEEALWDGFVWQVYLPSLVGWPPGAAAGGLSFWVALLSVPQIVHYFLDAWVWKLDGSNPGLAQALSLPR